MKNQIILSICALSSLSSLGMWISSDEDDKSWDSRLNFTMSGHASIESSSSDSSDEFFAEDKNGQYQALTKIYIELSSYSSDEQSEPSDEDPCCHHCGTLLLNTSFEYVEEVDATVCADCFYFRYWWMDNDDASLTDENCSQSADSSDEGQELIDDEPLFNHKQGNAEAYKKRRHHRAKRSTIRKWHRNPKDLTRKQLKYLQSLQ